MFNWFRKNGSNGQRKKDSLPFVDINGEPLQEGDWVEAHRYDLGTCKVLKGESGWEYESLEDGKKVSYARMIDAATKHQKVRKLDSPPKE